MNLPGGPLMMPREAFRLLRVRDSVGYELLASGRLKSVTVGGRRRISMRHVEEYLSSSDPVAPKNNGRRRRRGRKASGTPSYF